MTPENTVTAPLDQGMIDELRAVFGRFRDWTAAHMASPDDMDDDSRETNFEVNAFAFMVQEAFRGVGTRFKTDEADEARQAIGATAEFNAMVLALGQYLASATTDTDSAVEVIHMLTNRAFSVAQNVQARRMGEPEGTMQ